MRQVGCAFNNAPWDRNDVSWTLRIVPFGCSALQLLLLVWQPLELKYVGPFRNSFGKLYVHGTD